ncbi:MAG: RecQ family ATP-dependent DNA helicase [Bacteroidota bacterium]|nr:RecQ family ATP-dependent DNA helicase [Bacteroidota bacterium]
MNNSINILQQYWGHASFRGEQEAIIASVLSKKDTLALLPTGGGKSICFQVPAMQMEGLCLVITPLIALMKDQVEHLQQKNIPAIALHSGLSYVEVKQVLSEAVNGAYKFLYVSPERLESFVFREHLSSLNICLLAVDEAHCISQWGYDFRPSYLKIAQLREELPGIPIIALTASATPFVQADILTQLRFRQYNTFKQSFARPNLSYSVFKEDSKINKLLQILKNVTGCSIVYCKSRKQTQVVSDLLVLQNIKADYYHAGLTQQERNRKQTAWIQNQIRVMVCTNAFGMGIDKPDVRSVIHFDVPDCLENYYQEAGRAGRDGIKSYAVLLYHTEDIDQLKALPNQRFPEIQQIRQVYQHVADYLQIPVGIGEGNYYDFDINDFSNKFSVDTFLATSVLKILEQEGHISFNESVFLPSKVQFTVSKEALESFEQSHLPLEPIITCLLRTYGGIFDISVSIFEKQIAKLLRISVQQIQLQLLQLHSLGIIEYKPQKDTPQIYFRLNRAPALSLHININQYFERKKKFTERVDVMLTYLFNTTQCRSKYIANYFGDDTTNECRICDACIARNKQAGTASELAGICQQVLMMVDNKQIHINDLLQQLSSTNKEKVWEALKWLQAENKIQIHSTHMIEKQ